MGEGMHGGCRGGASFAAGRFQKNPTARGAVGLQTRGHQGMNVGDRLPTTRCLNERANSRCPWTGGLPD